MLFGGIVAWNSTFGVGMTLLGFGTTLWWCFGNWLHHLGVYFKATISNRLPPLKCNILVLSYHHLLIYTYASFFFHYSSCSAYIGPHG